MPSALDHAKAHNEHATRPNQHDEAWAAGEIECEVAGRSLSSTEEAAMSGDSHDAVPCEQFVGFDGECCGRCGFGAWQHNKVSS